MRLLQNIEVLPFENGDIEGLSALHKKSFDQRWENDFCLSLLSDKNLIGFVASLEEDSSRKLCGFIIARVICDESELLSIAVDPNYRNKGIASTLLKFVLNHLLGKGAKRIFLEVDQANFAARALYKRCNFMKIGFRPSYYVSPYGYSNALVLRCIL
ncbi:MAG: ribosomal-protein-alanine N-acetyltransferase [Candidatus Tokpelaia sp. JSC161]|jgi:ribosomal-protein-alanine N-acetyltransferase|nr:MAG: ribosomal-protein-alanine N-acetyltransferase [Candidatus Tokpelaia sp. JSC161]